jgi:lipopolysaccharide transport protein LptA
VLRLRFFRILLPLLLVVLGVLVWRSWEPRSAVHRTPGESGDAGTPRAEGLSIIEFGPGSASTFAGHADVFEPQDDGSLHLEGIRDLEIQREGRGPLLVSAGRGVGTGAENARSWHFEDEVVFREPEAGLHLVLPSLEIDDDAGEARSRGDIRFFAPDLEGRAEALVYGLTGQPGELERPELEDRRGGKISAQRGRFLDGIRDVELIGDVRVVQAAKRLDAGKLRLVRGPEDRLRQAVATERVAGEWSGGPEQKGTLRGERFEIRWDGAGEIEFLGLGGGALLTRADETLAASTIEAARNGGGAARWNIDAADDVYVQGRFGGAPGLLRAEHLLASLDDALLVREAEARGRVRFEGRDTRAEAERGTFVAGPGRAGEIELFGDDLRKARLAQGRTRVAARTIRTDVRGTKLVAQELVEATVLPEPSGSAEPSRARLFVTEQAIHFVSNRLESEDAGARLEFTGSVRGWQGERNLAAGTVIVDQRRNTLQAREAVSTRIPRESTGVAAAEEDYIQIGADQLDYDDASGLAVYEGQVRVRLVEGWLEAERVEVELALDSRQIHAIRASNAVRVEFHRASEGEMARPVSGTADRLVYQPAQASVRLFGDQAPAAVRRLGEGGGTTTGRELHYRLDTGTLDVESGEQGPGRIRS